MVSGMCTNPCRSIWLKRIALRVRLVSGLGTWLQSSPTARQKHLSHTSLSAHHPTSLNPAYEVAKKILSQAPNNPEVFEEAQLDEFVTQIEDEVRAHDTQ